MFKNLKYFLDTSVLVAHTDAVRASCVLQSDPVCLTCWRYLGYSGKWPAWPKMKIVSSQAKRKSIHTGGKANKVPVSEIVPSGRCSKEDRRSSTVAHACSITTEFVTQFATDISTTPGSPQLYLRDLCLQHKLCSVQVWNTMLQWFTLQSHWCIGTPTYKAAEKLLHSMFMNSSFSTFSSFELRLNKQLINPEKTKTSWISDDDKTFHSKNVSYTAKLDKKWSPTGFVSNFLGYFW